MTFHFIFFPTPHFIRPVFPLRLLPNRNPHRDRCSPAPLAQRRGKRHPREARRRHVVVVLDSQRGRPSRQPSPFSSSNSASSKSKVPGRLSFSPPPPPLPLLPSSLSTTRLDAVDRTTASSKATTAPAPAPQGQTTPSTASDLLPHIHIWRPRPSSSSPHPSSLRPHHWHHSSESTPRRAVPVPTNDNDCPPPAYDVLASLAHVDNISVLSSLPPPSENALVLKLTSGMDSAWSASLSLFFTSWNPFLIS